MSAATPPSATAIYRRALRQITESGVPFLVGGGYALERWTGIHRRIKDLDVFLRRRDVPAVVAHLRSRGWTRSKAFPHWLVKMTSEENLVDVDLIFSSGNGVTTIDDEWFVHAVPARVLDTAVQLCPVEETIWSKSYVMERERYDGADVAHLLLARGRKIDWPRLVARFGAHWPLLLSHLILFRFIYPTARGIVPLSVLRSLLRRVTVDGSASGADARLCRGTLLSRAQYLVDIEGWQFLDPRLAPRGRMAAEDIETWTRAAEREGCVSWKREKKTRKLEPRERATAPSAGGLQARLPEGSRSEQDGAGRERATAPSLRLLRRTTARLVRTSAGSRTKLSSVDGRLRKTKRKHHSTQRSSL